MREDEVDGLALLYRDSVLDGAPELYSPDQVAAWARFPQRADEFREFVLKPDTFVLDEGGRERPESRLVDETACIAYACGDERNRDYGYGAQLG